MVRVAVNPEVIRWALQHANTPEALEKKFPKLLSWINNEKQPTLNQLEKFSKATSVPLGYFFLSKPPKLQMPIPHYRTIDDTYSSKPSSDLLETIQTMQRRQAWMREYLLDLGQEPLPYVGSRKMTDNPKDVARDIRRTLQIENGWAADCKSWQEALNMLMAKIEQIGILVVRNGIVGNNTHRKLDVKEFRGFVLVDEYAPLIFINGADGKAAQMFTISHELSHIWFGKSAVFDLINLQPSRNEVEQTCNMVAAEFLVPEDELRSVWEGIKDSPERFNFLARHFKVSSIVTARRALDLMLISKDEFFDFYRGWMENERNKTQSDERGGDFYLNQHYRIGRRFAEAVFTSVKEGSLQFNEAYRLTGLKGDSFAEYARHLGIEVYS